MWLWVGRAPHHIMEDAADGERRLPPSSERTLPIRESALRDILQSAFLNGTKINAQALSLSSVYIRAFIEEAWARAAAEAADSGDNECDETHLEKILPQLLLDMGP